MTDKKKIEQSEADPSAVEGDEEISEEERKAAEEIGNVSVGDPSNATSSTGADAEQAGEGTVTEGGGAAGGTSGN